MISLLRKSGVVCWLWLITLLPNGKVLIGQPFECDGSAFLATVNDDKTETNLFISQTNRPQENKWELIRTYANQAISPIGFNPENNLIYGIDQTNWDLITIDKGGEPKILASLIGKLDTTFEYHAGAIAPSGNRFHLIQRDPETGVDVRLINIRLDNNTYRVGRVSLTSSFSVALGDIAVSPRYGILMGYDEINRTLVDISVITGLVTSFNYTSNSIGKLGSLFFARGDVLLGYGSSSSGQETTLFNFDILNGKSTEISSENSGDETDGCSCAYQVFFDKKISQNKALPCSEQLITYYTQNLSGANHSFVSLTDTLPAGIEILKVERLHRGTSIDTVDNQQLFSLSMRELLLGKDSTVIRIKVQEETGGELESQGFMRGLPLALDTLLSSDDPITELKRDPTKLSVVPLSLDLPDSTFICEGSSAKFNVTPNVQDTSIQYIWNNGVDLPSVSTDIPGFYEVMATSTCQMEEAGILVSTQEKPLLVSLEGDTQILQGESASIQAISTESPDNLSYFWDTNPEVPFDCQSCDRISLSPLEDVEVAVLLEDIYGCKASASTQIFVDKSRSLLINTVFSPNEDGINDYFFVKSTGIAMVKEVQVVNSWGRTVFEERDLPVNVPSLGWNGTYGGEPLSEGVYYWQIVIEYPDSSQERKKGQVTLLR